MADSNCRIGATYIGSAFDELLGLFGMKPERAKANDCAAEKGAVIQTERVDGGPELGYKTIATYYKVVEGRGNRNGEAK